MQDTESGEILPVWELHVFSIQSCCEPKTVLLKSIFKKFPDSLMGKPLWLGTHASTAGGMGLILVWGTKNLHAAWYSQKEKERSVSKKGRKHLSLIRII